jgi:hypothetical protein
MEWSFVVKVSARLLSAVTTIAAAFGLAGCGNSTPATVGAPPSPPVVTPAPAATPKLTFCPAGQVLQVSGSDTVRVQTASSVPVNPHPSYTPVGADSVYFKWVARPSCDYVACMQAYAYADNGCPSELYVEVQLTDKAGTVVGMTNAVASGLGSGQRALLTFDITANGKVSGHVNKVDCLQPGGVG